MHHKKNLVIMLIILMTLIIFAQPISIFAQGQGNGGGQGGNHDVGSSEEEDGDGEEGKQGSGNRGGINRGGKGQGNRGGDSKKDNHGGTITVNVTVAWPNDVTPQEVAITLIRDGVPTTKATVDSQVTFESEASGDCQLIGEAVPGFSIPMEDISLIGDKKTYDFTLEYIQGTFDVEGVEIKDVSCGEDENLNDGVIEVIKGYPHELIANVLPENANNQGVTWSSSNESIVTITNGVVEGMDSGEATVTVTTDDGHYTASCQVKVASITSLESLANIEALKGEVVVLPKTITVYLDGVLESLGNTNSLELPIIWTDEYGNPIGPYYQVGIIPDDPPMSGDYDVYLNGSVVGYDSTLTLTINVDMSGMAIPVENIVITPNLLSLSEGGTAQLDAIITPTDATTKDVVWSSTDDSIVSVDENGLITGESQGIAIITATTVDGGFVAYCQVSVSLVPEIELIYPTLEDGVISDHFDDLEEVYINVENLVSHLNESDDEFSQVKYYVKVEDKGGIEPLGNGEVIIYSDSTEFNLYDVTHFEPTDNYSSRYYVYMSQYPDYPKDDEKTLSTNFMGGTSTPTIPTSSVNVTLEMVGGTRTPENIIFLLCRELDTEAGATTWQEYYTGDDSKLPITYKPDDQNGHENDYIDVATFLANFSDEVKMTGVANSQGVVIWNVPKETLKLGGYFLLEVTPPGYVDNLNLVNPNSDDGELLKEVHLVRDGTIDCHVTNTYIGTIDTIH